MTIARDNRGQATVLTVVFLVVLCGMAALVLDVGSWYRADRALQQTADAAALAGAQGLPDSPSTATALAIQYANKNGGGLDSSGISFSGAVVANDTISVKMTRPAPGFFSKVLGLASVTVAAHAAARSANAGEALYVAPIAVNYLHPMLTGCKPKPVCTDDTTINLYDLHSPGGGDAAGSFDLINLRKNDSTGSVGSGDLSTWITDGFQDYLPLGDYYAVPSTKWNSSQVKSAMQIREGTILLFPIYDKITGPGDNAQFHVIGWAAFYVTSFSANGSSGSVSGHFLGTIAQGLQVKSSKDAADYGVRVIKLVD
jgi:putative Flp pilus-assembly TadE/G-like protein